ncbi:hypothetical protein ACLMJK_001787 [Lecanora helva]
MPPKKRGRVTSRVASTPPDHTAESTTDGPATPAKTDAARDETTTTTTNLWTDEQETSLFKAMIRWKPSLSSHGHNGYTAPRNTHIRIPGIWEKLGSLYNLEVLDLREDATGDLAQAESEEISEPFYEFVLPEEEFWDKTFARRLASEGSSSPPSLPHQLSNLPSGSVRVTRYSTVEDTDEPRSSPASARGTPTGRNTRTAKGTRGSRLAEVTLPGRRRTSKGSVEQGTEEEEPEDGDEDAMDVDEDDTKSAPKGRGKAAKGAKGTGSTRRSGRKK